MAEENKREPEKPALDHARDAAGEPLEDLELDAAEADSVKGGESASQSPAG